MQFVGVLFWLASNAYVLAKSCAYLDKFVYASVYLKYSCYNTVIGFTSFGKLLQSLYAWSLAFNIRPSKMSP